ncbi:unnamed protein product [Lymnaea stagnalis]|uniref:MATH domain-containing protein n=1 Tax=Lymnaea stagnalis TaxID=6523 RepID=A0AAV2HHF9_LYMST
MDFLKAFKEAEKLGLTFDTFKGIWDKESESNHLSVELRLLELRTERSRMGLSGNPEQNLLASDQFQEVIRETKHICQTLKQLTTNVDNVLTEMNNNHRKVQINLEKSVERQRSISKLCEKIFELSEACSVKIMKEFCNVVTYIREQSRHDTDLIRTYIQQECQFLYHDQARGAATRTSGHDCLPPQPTTDAASQPPGQVVTDVHGRPEPVDVVTDVHEQPGQCDVSTPTSDNNVTSHVQAHRVDDVVSVLMKSYNDTTSSTGNSTPTFLDTINFSKDVAVISQATVIDQYGHEIAMQSMQYSKTDFPTAQELPSEMEAWTLPRRSTQRRLSRHSKSRSNAKIISEENSQGKQTDQAGENFQSEEKERGKEKYQDGEKGVAKEEDRDKQEDEAKEKVEKGKKEQAKEMGQGKEKEQATEICQDKEKDQSEHKTQIKDEVQFEEPAALANKLSTLENQADSKVKAFKEIKKHRPLQSSTSHSEKSNRARSSSESSTLGRAREDFSRRSFRVVDPVAKFIPDTGLTFELLSSYFITPSFYETDYLYTLPKTRRVKLRLGLKKGNALSIQLFVSQGATVGEPTWPIYFHGIGKIYNSETKKPSLLWKFSQSCGKPSQGEEIKLDATVCLVTPCGSYQDVTLQLLRNNKFEMDDRLKFFWKLTAD